MKTSTTVKIDREVWHKLKIFCAKETVSMKSVLSQLAKQFLKKEGMS